LDEPFLCFQRRAVGDVLLGEHKIAGSAQRRRGGAILQHGSVLLARSPYAPELPGISDLCGRTVAFDQLVQPLADEIAASLQLRLCAADVTEAERTLAASLQDEKYSARSWTARR
jgi:lipoate-protein ligase A